MGTPQIIRTCAHPGDGAERVGGLVLHFDNGARLAFVWHAEGGLAVLDRRGVWLHAATAEEAALLDSTPATRAWRELMERLAERGGHD